MITMDPLVVGGILGRPFRAIPGLLPAMAASLWKVAVSGLCGSLTHSLLMFAQHQLGISLSISTLPKPPARAHQLDRRRCASGRTVADFLSEWVDRSESFARLYRKIPGNSGAMKGFISGILGWLVMDLIFFPLLGLGPFASEAGLGVHPALFSLLMMLTYSIMMGFVYGRFDQWSRTSYHAFADSP